ncbi:hypothetical protein EK0264_09025 [Epidermidibacterium keratini]|uniref:RidA family protein n=1 Tax=Epidermidibacterium keratini TaxID=1891644 RepID=A0A7L4YNM2_9ACTN|nr:hypothetical protein [Epidermidibacterium keratini]QHC00409.1 hypothetical protein EK0264_09025 [Epidermidibacterium keratini]
MELIAHNPSDGPSLGSYSQSVEVRGAARTLYISGQVPEDSHGAVPDGFKEQCRPALTVIITGIYSSKWLLEIEAIAAD